MSHERHERRIKLESLVSSKDDPFAPVISPQGPLRHLAVPRPLPASCTHETWPKHVERERWQANMQSLIRNDSTRTQRSILRARERDDDLKVASNTTFGWRRAIRRLDSRDNEEEEKQEEKQETQQKSTSLTLDESAWLASSAYRQPRTDARDLIPSASNGSNSFKMIRRYKQPDPVKPQQILVRPKRIAQSCTSTGKAAPSTQHEAFSLEDALAGVSETGDDSTWHEGMKTSADDRYEVGRLSIGADSSLAIGIGTVVYVDSAEEAKVSCRPYSQHLLGFEDRSILSSYQATQRPRFFVVACIAIGLCISLALILSGIFIHH